LPSIQTIRSRDVGDCFFKPSKVSTSIIVGEGQNRKMGRIITYADYFATNFFRKEGFCKGVSLPKEEWEGYIKDYRSANLMEYIIKPSIDYEYMI
jgi:hypothetical protein